VKKITILGSIFSLLCCVFSARALVFHLPANGNDLVGHIRIAQIKSGDTFYKLARRYEMGYDELVLANKNIKRYGRLRKGRGIIIPAYFILPDAPRKGIVINLPERRLYYYPQGQNIVLTEPVAVGEYGWPTPLMIGTVIEKIKDPAWHVPESIQLEQIAKGEEPKTIVPAGPNNPLGQYALRLSAWSVLIHGTNAVTSIGKRASHGCIRMYPEDIEEMFYRVPEETPIRIIDQPYKLGWKNGKLYLEVHETLLETRGTIEERVKKVYDLIMEAIGQQKEKINWEAVKEALINQTGVPQLISRPGILQNSEIDYSPRVITPTLYYEMR